MKKAIIGLVFATGLVSCAAKTANEVAQVGAGSAAGLTQGLAALPVYTSFASQKTSSTATTLGDIIQQTANNYMIFQFVSTICASCPDETKSINAALQAGRLPGVSHQVVMTSGEAFTDRLQTFANNAQINVNSMVNDFDSETIRAIYQVGNNFQVPLIVLLDKSGGSKQFRADASVTPDQHINNVIAEIQAIVNQ